MKWEDLFSHPYIGTPIASAAVVHPWLTDGLPIVLQVLGGIFLLMQIYYLFKNKGKK